MTDEKKKEDKHGFQPIKAYKNSRFLNSPDARALRILSEYLEPDSRFREFEVADTVVFFGSARIKARDAAEAALAEVKEANGDVARAERDIKMSRFYEDTRELARRLTEWSKDLAGAKEKAGEHSERRFIVCSGGGPGVMEAANRGASEAKGINIGLGISLPHEQFNNPHITRELSFEFHYFFMRKLWFVYLAKALVVFPGGFGTLDEMFESLTLIQTGKLRKHMPIVLYGKEFWNSVVNLDALVEYGTISESDLDLFTIVDDVDTAFEVITQELQKYVDEPRGPRL